MKATETSKIAELSAFSVEEVSLKLSIEEVSGLSFQIIYILIFFVLFSLDKLTVSEIGELNSENSIFSPSSTE